MLAGCLHEVKKSKDRGVKDRTVGPGGKRRVSMIRMHSTADTQLVLIIGRKSGTGTAHLFRSNPVALDATETKKRSLQCLYSRDIEMKAS